MRIRSTNLLKTAGFEADSGVDRGMCRRIRLAGGAIQRPCRPGSRCANRRSFAYDPLLNKANLDRIKRHIIAQGRRCTYVTMYNDNPCWSLPPYMFYLNPDPSPDGHPQWNINSDTRRGDFNTLVITDSASSVDPGSVEFRRAGGVAFRRCRGEVSPDEAGRSEAVFRAAVRAALKAVGEH